FFFQAEDGIRDFHVTGVQTWLFRSEGILAAYQVAYSSEEERPKRAHHESNGEGSEIGDVRKGGVSRRIEFQGQDSGETSENIERSEERRVGKECRKRRSQDQ